MTAGAEVTEIRWCLLQPVLGLLVQNLTWPAFVSSEIGDSEFHVVRIKSLRRNGVQNLLRTSLAADCGTHGIAGAE
jgi:hypothetical protein